MLRFPGTRRVAILADIGQPSYHVGDEAMAHGAVRQLRQRGVTDLLPLTRDPAATQRRFGRESRAARTLDFPWHPISCQRYLEDVRAVLAGATTDLPAGDVAEIRALVAALRGVDALLIAGGGNMNSTYRWLLYERAAVVHIAAALGKPVVISGQTLGPDLTEPDAAVLRDLLAAASLVGLRDDASHAVATRLCPGHGGLRRCADDATLLGGVPRAGGPAARHGGPVVVATFSPATGDVRRAEAARAYARLLDHVATAVAGTVTFLPHQATPELLDGDAEFHAAIATHMAKPATLAPIRDALETARRTAAADLVVTSRYHPLVFGYAAAVPVLAVSPGQYTDVRFDGVLGTWGLATAPLPLATLVDGARDPRRWGEVAGWADAIVANRAALSAALRAARPAVVRAHAAWWDDVVGALGAVGAPEQLTPGADRAEPGTTPAPPPAAAGRTRPAGRPRVSVVIPAFNPGPFLRQTLMSVVTQTMADWEAVVVDDGSSEDLSWVDGLDPRIRRIRQDNRGLSAARNRGLAEARGDLVAFLDADDLWHPDKLAHQVPFFDDPEVALVSSDYAVIDEAGLLLGDGYAVDALTWPDLVTGNGIGVSTVVMRREVAVDLGGFDEGLRQAEDWDLWLRVARAHRIVKCPRVLAGYRLHGGQMTRNYMALRANELTVLKKQVAAARAAGAPDVETLARAAMKDMDRKAGTLAFHLVRQTPLRQTQEIVLHAVRAVRLAPGYAFQRLGAKAWEMARRPPHGVRRPPRP